MDLPNPKPILDEYINISGSLKKIKISYFSRNYEDIIQIRKGVMITMY